MTFTHLRAALVCLLLAVAMGTAPSAQAKRAQNRPAPAPPVEVTREPAPVEQTESRSRFRRPIFRAFQNYTLHEGDVVRDVRTVFGDATIEGHVEGPVLVIMGSAHLASTAVIDGPLVVVGGAADAAAGARVRRDLVVIGGTLEAPSTFSPDGNHVVIGTPWFGDVMSDVLPWITRGLLWGRVIVPELPWVWVVLSIFFFVYLALNTAFTDAVTATADVVTGRPLSAFVGGLLVLVLAVPVLAIVAASVIGLVIVPFLLCGLVAAALVGKTAVARSIGRGIVRAESPEGRLAAFFAFFLGFVLLTLAYMVPLLGFVVWALTTVLGLGAATATLRAHLRRERKTTVPSVETSPVAGSAAVVPPGDIAPDATLPAPPPLASAVAGPALEPPPLPPLFNQGLAQYPRATFLDRLAAFVLDCVLVAIATELLDLHRNDGAFFFLLLCYHIAFWAWRGTTLGGIICNLRVTRTDGTDPRFVDALVRGLSSIFSIVALGIGCLWMLQDSERQMWHDKIAGTLVVKVPRHLVLP